jgi:GTP-binding protein
VNSNLSIVDLPGYGFAKVPEKIRRRWGSMVETYLKTRKELRLTVLLLDARHTPTGQDLQLAEWLRHYRIPSVAVATKIDKIPRSKWQSQIGKIREGLSGFEGRIIPFSATTGEGRDTLWKEIIQACQKEPTELS